LEGFKPLRNVAPDTLTNKAEFVLRLIFDFQILTIYRDLKGVMPGYKGKVLDIGCGLGAYKHLLKKGKTEYYGIDIDSSEKFDYRNKKILAYDGKKIPYRNNYFDHFICTEVLEHVPEAKAFISEAYRVLKKGGSGILTIPWSARFHYIPHDYHRYTPSMLKKLFEVNFKKVRITTRGTDITVIASKIIVLWLRCINSAFRLKILYLLLLPIAILFIPFILPVVLIAHLSIVFRIGSEDDPLGYTVFLEK